MESENQEIQEELRLMTGAKSDSEGKRRKQEQQLQDYSARLQDAERARNDYQDRTTKAQVSYFFKFSRSELSWNLILN